MSGAVEDPDEAAPCLRPMELDDVAAAVEIEEASYSEPWPADQFTDLLELSVGFGWVAEDDAGRMVAYAMGWVVADEAELANVAVTPESRGRGLGTRLLRRFMADAARRGARKVYLEVRESNAAARALYERHGFRVVGRREAYYRSPEEDALVMKGDPRDAVDPPETGR